jgi:hypothetical protein
MIETGIAIAVKKNNTISSWFFITWIVLNSIVQKTTVPPTAVNDTAHDLLETRYNVVIAAVNATVIAPIIGMTIKPTKLKGAKQNVATNVSANSLNVTAGGVRSILVA